MFISVAAVENSDKARELLDLLKSKCGSWLLDAKLSLGDAEIRVSRQNSFELLSMLKKDGDLCFNYLVDVTAVDYFDHSFMPRAEDGRFEVVYHLMSLGSGKRLRVKVSLPEDNPEIESVTSLWAGANFMEREAWDMFGVVFKNHPDLRRILLYEEFKGHPLRKDYPLQGKQPRVPLRYPEVTNSSREMRRPALIKINSPKSAAEESGADKNSSGKAEA